MLWLILHCSIVSANWSLDKRLVWEKRQGWIGRLDGVFGWLEGRELNRLVKRGKGLGLIDFLCN